MTRSPIKELSDSRSGAVFGEWDYNEGLKFGNFRYFMCRSKCFGPNKTNFINLWQKLLILEPLYEKKHKCYFHVGYAIKLHWKKLVQFWIGHQIAKNCSICKNWKVLRLAMSCQLEFVRIRKVKWCLGGLNYIKIIKKRTLFSAIFRKSPQGAPKIAKTELFLP